MLNEMPIPDQSKRIVLLAEDDENDVLLIRTAFQEGSIPVLKPEPVLVRKRQIGTEGPEPA